jgi:PAS domain S-box-containing protein
MAKPPLRILIVEDNPGDRLLIEDYLLEEADRAEVVHVGTLTGARERLESGHGFHAVLLDLALPDAVGEPLVTEVLALLRGQTPVIVLTGQTTRDLGVQTLQLGVTDYLMKDGLTAHHLYKSITYSMERHRLSQRMAQTTRRLQNAQEIARLGYWEFDFATDSLFWSDKTFEILGADPATFGMRFSNFRRMVHPDDLAAFDASRGATIAEGKLHDIEHRIIRPDGSTAHVYQRGELVRDAMGNPLRLEGIIQDITYRMEQEQHLRLLESAITHAKDVIMITDSDLDEPGPRILFVNEAFTEMTGYTAEEAIGRSPRFLQGPDTDTEELRRVREMLTAREDCQVELLNYHRDGTAYWVELSMVPVTNAQGECTHFISIERDVTERKRNEALLRDFADNMEKKVLQRTEELQKAHELLNYQHRHIRDSINYAKRIQEAIIPTEQELQAVLPDSFVLFRPLDVVSGDFLWHGHTGNGITLVAAVDCTGHGVPGALMSMIGHQLLDQVLKLHRYSDPGLILTELHREIRRLFSQRADTERNSRNAVTDGMDVALCAIDREGGTISFCGARRPLYLSGPKGVHELHGSKFTIGAEDRMQVDPQLKTTTVQYTPGTCVYLTTDGYYDQFGGPDDGKMLKRRFLDRLGEIHALPMHEQKEHLDAYFTAWKGDARQTDDVLVVGIRL